jgi:hypothetical protein
LRINNFEGPGPRSIPAATSEIPNKHDQADSDQRQPCDTALTLDPAAEPPGIVDRIEIPSTTTNACASLK